MSLVGMWPVSFWSLLSRAGPRGPVLPEPKGLKEAFVPLRRIFHVCCCGKMHNMRGKSCVSCVALDEILRPLDSAPEGMGNVKGSNSQITSSVFVKWSLGK